MSFRKLLCPIDFSAESDYAFRVAVQLATRHQAELVLVHVWHAGAYTRAGEKYPATDIEDVIDDVETSLAAAVRDARNLGVERASSNVILGYAAQELVTLLRDDPTFDLVVMGTRGRTGLVRVLGSVTDAVVRHSPCPVLVTRVRPEPARFGRLLCAVDFSESSRDATRLAASIVDRDGRITLLHAEEPGEPAHRVALLAEWAAELERAASAPVTARLQPGSPTAAILATLEEQPPFDLVVMGSRGRTGMRALLGSVAEAIIRRAPCPVLVARAR